MEKIKNSAISTTNIFSITNAITSYYSSEVVKVISVEVPLTFSNSISFSLVIVSVSIELISFSPCLYM